MDLPDNLLRSVSREGLGALIEYDDIALHIGGDDAIHRAGNQVCKKFICFPELIFNPFTFGDITYIGVNLSLAFRCYRLGDAYLYILCQSSCSAKLTLRTGLLAIVFRVGKKLLH